jgi:hypothetical protein
MEFQNKIDEEQDRRICELEKSVQTVRTSMNQLDIQILWIKDNLRKVSDKVDVIEATLLGRPSWFITTIISFMAGIIGVLATTIISYIIFND